MTRLVFKRFSQLVEILALFRLQDCYSNGSAYCIFMVLGSLSQLTELYPEGLGKSVLEDNQ